MKVFRNRACHSVRDAYTCSIKAMALSPVFIY
nr:MAG TPA: hypothetical protein [Caudoviricetes sp.]